MSNLDVALRLKWLYDKAGATAAKKDIAGIGDAAKGLAKSRGVDQIGRDLEQAAIRAKRLERQLAGLKRARGFTGLAPELDAASGHSVRLARNTARIASHLEKATGRAAALRAELSGVAGAAERADRAAAGLRRISRRDGRGGSRADGGRVAVGARERGAEGGVGPGALGAGLSGAAAARFGVAAAGISGGALMVGNAVRQAAKSSMDFERAMIEVGKATDASGPDLDAYAERVMKLARETGKTKEELAAMLASAGFAGRPVGELMRFTEYAAKATAAWRTSAEETAQGLAEIGNIYQANQGRIEQIGDAVNAMADKSASKEADLLEFLRRAGASSNQAGISAEETLAFGAAMKEVGVRTEVAATGFEALLNVMKLGDKFSHKAGDGLKALGVNSDEMRKKFVAKPVETMVELLERLNKVADPMKRAEIMTDLFGKEYQDDIAKLLNGLPQIVKYLGIMRDRAQSAGSVRMQFAEQMAKDVSKIDRATQSLDVLKKRLGDPIKVAAGGVADQINAWIEKLEQGDTTLQRFIGRLAEIRTQAQKAGVLGGSSEEGDIVGRIVTGIIQQIDPKFGKSADEQERMDKDAQNKREAETLAKPDRLREQLQRKREEREGLLKRAEPHMKGGPGVQRDAASDALAKSASEIGRLESELAAATAAVQAVMAERAKEVAAIEKLMETVQSMVRLNSFGLDGVHGEAGQVGSGRDAFGFGPNGTKNRAVPVPPSRPPEFKAEVKAEPQDLSGVGKQTMDTYGNAVKSGLERTEAEVKAIIERMKASLSFTATPTITPRISAPAPSGGGGASPARATGGGGGAPTVRSAGLRRGGGGGVTVNGPINVHGVTDVASLHRGIQREADRKVREARNDALHDTGNDFT